MPISMANKGYTYRRFGLSVIYIIGCIVCHIIAQSVIYYRFAMSVTITHLRCQSVIYRLSGLVFIMEWNCLSL